MGFSRREHQESPSFLRGDVVKLKRDGSYKIGRVIKLLSFGYHVHWWCEREMRFRISTESFDALGTTTDDEKTYLKTEAIKHNARLYLAYMEHHRKKNALKREELRARYSTGPH